MRQVICDLPDHLSLLPNIRRVCPQDTSSRESYSAISTLNRKILLQIIVFAECCTF